MRGSPWGQPGRAGRRVHADRCRGICSGDCATARMRRVRDRGPCPLALKANKQGLIAGMNIAGVRGGLCRCHEHGHHQGLRSGRCTDRPLVRPGPEAWFEPEKVTVTSRDMARITPGLLLLTPGDRQQKDRRVLGAQLAGRPEAVKRDRRLCDRHLLRHDHRPGVRSRPCLRPAPFSPVNDPGAARVRVARKTK